MKSTCMICVHSCPHLFACGQSRNVGHLCTKTNERVWPDRRAPICDLFEVEQPKHGWQPEMPAELL